MQKKKFKIHIGLLPGGRKKIYVTRDIYVTLHALRVSTQEQRGCGPYLV
jgi:hypothetical protein